MTSFSKTPTDLKYEQFMQQKRHQQVILNKTVGLPQSRPNRRRKSDRRKIAVYEKTRHCSRSSLATTKAAESTGGMQMSKEGTELQM
jgi:hypothetical protein